MELWFIILVSISISLLLKATINLLSPPRQHPKLPPGPRTFPFIGNLLWLRRSLFDIEPILRSLHSKLGPMVTLHIGTRPSIFISDRVLAHQALIQNGAVFADRPPPLPISKIIGSSQHNINSASYGPTWRTLRRNLTAEILHPSRLKNYAHARKWVLGILVNKFKSETSNPSPVFVLDQFQYAMFCLLVLMCFGDKLEEKEIKKIEEIHQKFLSSARRFRILNFFPRVTKIFMYKRWQEFYQLIKEREQVLLPLIKSRQRLKQEAQIQDKNNDYVASYVDTLLDLHLPGEGNRKLNEEEIISLCSEFLNAGTDTTSTALQWIMANLVKYPEVQNKLFVEIKEVVRSNEVKEEDLDKLPFLKAIVLEGLRRHPPAHFVLPHSVTEDFVLNGHLLPKNASINFMVAEMGLDPKVWEDPMEFKPERFATNKDELGFDITGTREIKMMPFGVGRRICPGLALALLHLEYFVANLTLNFKWECVDGEEISLEEKQAFTMVMKYPLKAMVSPRALDE